MKIEKIEVGVLYTNCYILDKGKGVIVIDPGDNFSLIKRVLNDRKVLGIIVTHYHFDHIGALNELSKYTNAPIYDINNLNEGENSIGNFTFDTIYTPGHKEDLISIYFKEENSLFCGDFIFKGTIGRYDLEGGDFREMQRSIKKIITYPLDMKIYPGHGEETNLREELENLKVYL